MRGIAGEERQLDARIADGKIGRLALVLDLDDVHALLREQRQQRGEASRTVRHARTHDEVAPGDRVVTILDTGPDAVISWLAINRLGAVTVPINTAYKGEFLRHQMADAGAKICIVEAEYISNVSPPTWRMA